MKMYGEIVYKFNRIWQMYDATVERKDEKFKYII